MKKISKLVCLLFLSLLLAGCGGSKADMVETPANMRMQRGRNYREVIEDFQDKGFTNIKTNKIEDLQYGFVVRYEQVETITVGGDSNYDSGVKVPADTEVIISYHGYKTSSEDGPQEVKPAEKPAVNSQTGLPAEKPAVNTQTEKQEEKPAVNAQTEKQEEKPAVNTQTEKQEEKPTVNTQTEKQQENTGTKPAAGQADEPETEPETEHGSESAAEPARSRENDEEKTPAPAFSEEGQ